MSDLCSLNQQHQLCKNPRLNPDIKTLFTDHTCTPSNGDVAPAPVTLPVAAIAEPAAYTQLGAHGVYVTTIFCFIYIYAFDNYLILMCLIYIM